MNTPKQRLTHRHREQTGYQWGEGDTERQDEEEA